MRRATQAANDTDNTARISIHALLAESDPLHDKDLNPDGISIHALLAESDNRFGRPIDVQFVFLSTLSLRRATQNRPRPSARIYDFYPRSPCGERLPRHSVDCSCHSISIHALLAESDLILRMAHLMELLFLSTLSLRRATTDAQSEAVTTLISIHALLAESDGCQRPCGRPTTNFYPRSPCGERPSRHSINSMILIFLSTLSLRRATLAGPSGPAFLYNFYPRSPCGERPLSWRCKSDAVVISIHALLAESDCYLESVKPSNRYFYPRSPCGERQTEICPVIAEITISIHALLAESDACPFLTFEICVLFLSTLSLRRATPGKVKVVEPGFISIHALLAESDDRNLSSHCGNNNFYPRSPCGERRRRSVKLFRQNYISIHALLAESDDGYITSRQLPTAFLSTLSLRRATPVSALRVTSSTHFYPRSPCGERQGCYTVT